MQWRPAVAEEEHPAMPVAIVQDFLEVLHPVSGASRLRISVSVYQVSMVKVSAGKEEMPAQSLLLRAERGCLQML